MHTWWNAVGVWVLVAMLTSACATKGFVRTEVGQVNDKVTSLGTSLEETQQRVGAAEARISEVDGKAATAAKTAQTAQQVAPAAAKGSQVTRTLPARARQDGDDDASSQASCKLAVGLTQAIVLPPVQGGE